MPRGLLRLVQCKREMIGMTTVALEAAILIMRDWVAHWDPSLPTSKVRPISQVSSPLEIQPTQVDKATVCYFVPESSLKSSHSIVPSLARLLSGAHSLTILRKNSKKGMACLINQLLVAMPALSKQKLYTKTTNSLHVLKSINWAFKILLALLYYGDTCMDSSSMLVSTIVSAPSPNHLNITSTGHKRLKNEWTRSVVHELLLRVVRKRPRRRSIQTLPIVSKPRLEIAPRLAKLPRHWSKMIVSVHSLIIQTLKLTKRLWTLSYVIQVGCRQRRS
mmetsp:Transcript_8563/g.19202  ORF Transcript_8563/g.19202 Transcript_8563/m.19202 type:complete len:276 (+) Transcript_8563:1461-2288(+)